MKRLARATVAAVTVLGLGVPGIVGAASSIDGLTGPDSTNVIKTNNESDWRATNNNDLKVTANTSQAAHSGAATADDSTTAGDSTSGDAANASSMSASVSLNNSGTSAPAPSSDGGSGMGGSIGTTGPDSVNRVEENTMSTVRLTNNNGITVTNNVDQSATSGAATTSHNSTGGSATSGSVSNTSSSTFELMVTN